MSTIKTAGTSVPSTPASDRPTPSEIAGNRFARYAAHNALQQVAATHEILASARRKDALENSAAKAARILRTATATVAIGRDATRGLVELGAGDGGPRSPESTRAFLELVNSPEARQAREALALGLRKTEDNLKVAEDGHAAAVTTARDLLMKISPELAAELAIIMESVKRPGSPNYQKSVESLVERLTEKLAKVDVCKRLDTTPMHPSTVQAHLRERQTQLEHYRGELRQLEADLKAVKDEYASRGISSVWSWRDVPLATRVFEKRSAPVMEHIKGLMQDEKLLSGSCPE